MQRTPRSRLGCNPYIGGAGSLIRDVSCLTRMIRSILAIMVCLILTSCGKTSAPTSIAVTAQGVRLAAFKIEAPEIHGVFPLSAELFFKSVHDAGGSVPQPVNIALGT